MPRTLFGRFLLLLAAALSGLALIEGLARLAVRRPERFYEHMAERLPWARNLEYQQIFRAADEGFEKTWDYPAGLAADARNLVADPVLVFRLTPGLRLDAANYTLPKSARDKGNWLYNANTEGWRGPLSGERKKSALVFAALGDSATYGWGLEESQSWPAQMGDLLGEGAQVFNRAVPGYSSFQGARLLPQVLEDLAPNAVTFAYGGNDAIPVPLEDAQMAMELQKPLGRLREFLDRFALTRLFSRMISHIKTVPHLGPRVPPEEFRTNLEEMARSVQARGAAALLLGLCQHSPAHHEALVSASKNSRAPLLDFPWDAEGPEWKNAPASPACGKAAILEAARASPQGTGALAKTRELLGGPAPYFPDHCHPSPWGAALIARALACRVSMDRRVFDVPQRFSLIHTHRRPDVKSEGAPPLLLALHGIGSNEQDLIGLFPHLDGRFLTVSARAPYEYGPGYSWFGLEIGPQGVIVDEEQAQKSRETIIKFLGEITEAYQTDPKRTYLLGFSQGSIMSYSVLATAPEKLSGIVAMSGRFSPQLLSAMKGNALLKDFPILVTHGTQDQVLPIANSRSTNEALSRLPLRLTYKEYPMGHEVSLESIRDVKAWLGKRLDGE